MENIFSFNFPQLSVEDKVQLRRAIRAQRAQVLNTTLEKAQSPQLSERLGRRISGVHQFLGEMIFLSKENPDMFWRVLDHWATAFLLSRLLDQYGPDDPEQLDKLVSNLSGLLLFERLLSSTPSDTSATYVTHVDGNGRIHGLLHDASLEYNDECFKGKAVEWICSPFEVAVRLAGKDEAEFTLPLPIQDNPHVRLVPLASSESFEFSIIEEMRVWGRPKTRHDGVYKNLDNGASDWSPLTLKDSLTQAQEVIKDLWPEALEWVETLIPAFVDMGVPPSSSMRFSSSYDPGSPIFMSRVDNPIAHAEDVVHETQHHRLLLFADSSHFKSWRDLRQVYVSPYRQDPRPLRGLIIGLHAFLTVNELKRKIIDQKQAPESLLNEVFDAHYMNLFAFRTIIKHEEFGSFGKELFKQMGRTLGEQHFVFKSLATPELERSAEEKICRHIATLERQASDLKNIDQSYRNWDETAQLAASFA